MAEFVAEGVEREREAAAKLRTVPSLHGKDAEEGAPF
jgi:hypothetical protein